MHTSQRSRTQPAPSPTAGNRRHTGPGTGRRVAAAVLLAATLVPVAGCAASAGLSLPEDAYGTWHCSYFEPFTIRVEQGTFEWITPEWSAHGTWQHDHGRVIINDRVVVEGVPDTVDGDFMLQMLVSGDQAWAVDVIPADSGRRVELHFPDGRVTCTKQD